MLAGIGIIAHSGVSTDRRCHWLDLWPACAIHDVSPGLGGPFQAYYTNPKVIPAQNLPPFGAYGRWGVNLGVELAGCEVPAGTLDAGVGFELAGPPR
ncbi:MAG: hypothetical protein WBZ37_09280 [Mycobacterium sp.]